MDRSLTAARLYVEVGRRGYRRYAAYKGAAWAGVFTNTIFGFMRAAVYTALLASVTQIAGWDTTDTLTYTFVTQGMIMIVHLWGWAEIGDRIRSGDVITDLYRPLDFQAYWLAQDFGRGLYHAIYRGIAPFVIGAVFFHLRLPGRAWTWLAFAISVALAITIAFSIRFLVNLAAFWLLDWRGVSALVTATWSALSGFVIPLTFFPGALRNLAAALPFAATVQIPVEIFLEKPDGVAGLAGALGFQALWAAMLLAAGRLALAAASRKVVVQGG